MHSLDLNMKCPVLADHNMNSVDLRTQQLMCRNALAIIRYNKLAYNAQNYDSMSRSQKDTWHSSRFSFQYFRTIILIKTPPTEI